MSIPSVPSLPAVPTIPPLPTIPSLSPITLPAIGLFNGLGSLFTGDLPRIGANLGGLLNQAGGAIDPTPGTETFSGTIEYAGTTRRYVGIRPTGAPAGAPVLLLLHANGLQPERMANLTRAGRLAAAYGAWVYLPASQGHSWSVDGSVPGPDDSGFLNQLMTSEIAAHQLDATRLYAAGYSNGGFMAERLACDHPALLAGISIVAATLNQTVAAGCVGSQRLPVMIFDGTGDPITQYDGLPGLDSAPATAAFWATKNLCVPGDITTTDLPDIAPNDGTTVTVSRYNSCNRSAVALYTVNGGGHTWPGSIYGGYTFALGATTRDVDATLELWAQLLPFSR